MTTTISRLDVAKRIGIVTVAAAFDRMRTPTAITASDIPCSYRDITDSWLTAVLCTEVAGAKVVGHDLGGGSDGSTSRRAMTVHYNEIGTEAGLPTALFTKSTPTLLNRLVTAPTGAGPMEALFYQRIRPGLQIEAPLGYYAAFDSRTGRSMFLLEDVAHTRKATFGDTTNYVDRAHADGIVTTLAALHAAFWNDHRFGTDLTAVQGAEAWQLTVNKVMRFRSRTIVGIDRGSEVAPDEFTKMGRQFWHGFLRSLSLHAAGPTTLIHSDVHSRNWYIAHDGSMGLYDWQCATKGVWALDLTYALGSALTVEDRRAWESDLLRLYLDELAARGGPKLEYDNAWLAYRQQVFHGAAFWLITLGAGLLEPAMQPESVSLVNVERLTTMLIDLESARALDRHPTSGR